MLIFVPNDFIDNSPVLRGLGLGRSWELGNFPRTQELSVRRRPDGKMELLPPRASRGVRSGEEATGTSWFALWLRTVWERINRKLFPRNQGFVRQVEALRGRPGYAAVLEGWRPTNRRDMLRVFARRDLPPVTGRRVPPAVLKYRENHAFLQIWIPAPASGRTCFRGNDRPLISGTISRFCSRSRQGCFT